MAISHRKFSRLASQLSFPPPPDLIPGQSPSSAPQHQPQASLVIYSDGACSGNPGPGGWGSILLGAAAAAVVGSPPSETASTLFAPWVLELGGHDPATTNNRMEMTAVIEALRVALQRIQPPFVPKTGTRFKIQVHTDSNYLVQGINGWLKNWKKNQWRTAAGAPVKNQPLWQALDELTQTLTQGHHQLSFHFIKGHAGHPGNERADRIACQFSQKRPPLLFSGLRTDYTFTRT